MSWNELLNHSIVGTHRKSIKPLDFPDGLRTIQNIVFETHQEDERRLLSLAALFYQYHQCAALPLRLNNPINLSSAAAESLPYISDDALRLWNELLSQGEWSLLFYWLEMCKHTKLILRPYMLAELINISKEHTRFRQFLSACGGHRWAWLADQNFIESEQDITSILTSWAVDPSIQELPQEWIDKWELSKLQDRKIIFIAWRKKCPNQAFEALQKIWKEENANNRFELISLLGHIQNEDELQWAFSLLKDRSQKVKDVAIQYIKYYDQSPIHQEFIQLVDKAITMGSKKSLLGLVSKEQLQCNPSHIELNPEWEKWYVVMKSPDPNFTNAEYIISQCIAHLSINYWYQQYNLQPSTLITHLNEPALKKYFPSFISAAQRAEDTEFAISFFQSTRLFNIELFNLLPREQMLLQAYQFFNIASNEIISVLITKEYYWPLELSKSILNYIASENPLQLQHFVNENIWRMRGIQPSDINDLPIKTKSNYSDIPVEMITKTLRNQVNLKIQIIQAFSSTTQ